MTYDKLLKPYNPQETEDRIYEAWENSGLFNPDKCIETGVAEEGSDYFSIVLPPPNVTGTLHIGHAATVTIEDIMARFNRMKGKKTLWIPGTDHAAIATQSKVEKELQKKEKKSRHDLGREEFLKRVEAFAKESHDTIINQLKKMGASLDWSREAYTLDKKRSLAVNTAFKKMYDQGLIYRGYRVVNWDPKGQTTVSDDEVEHKESKGKLYTFKYSKEFPVPIATTRPETKLGDTGVAVNPNDKRYKDYIGKEFEVNFIGTPLKIKVVGDESVNPEFGTGAVGLTPAHSFVDWEIAQKHDLPMVQVINEYAKISIDNEKVKNKKTTEAREVIIEELKSKGLLEKEEEIDQNISTAERTGGIIEPLPKLQWFIDVNKKFPIPHSQIPGIKTGEEVTLKKLMLHVVESNQIEIIPDRFRKVYFHWVENLKDWCISRQIWYGHRVPVWYHDNKCVPKPGKEEEVGKCKEIVVSETEPKCQYCDAEYAQDPDTLDTWFSSGLWTLSSLGWPEDTEDLKNYHPTSVLETGYDILFFWIARMILMTTCVAGDVPFKKIYLHGLVRDDKGRKMSKSLGNIIDPLTMKEKYGADALRMSLIVGTGPGNDSNVSENKIKAYKHFANKIWNATRFVLENTKDLKEGFKPEITEKDRATLEEFYIKQKEITDDIENYKFYLAGEKLYHYFWHTFADIIIEDSKNVLQSKNSEERASRQWLLLEILRINIKMLHPFMPFITEEIWEMLPFKNEGRMLMVEKWPTLE